MSSSSYQGFSNKSTWLAFHLLQNHNRETILHFFENSHGNFPLFTGMLQSFIQENIPLSDSPQSIHGTYFYYSLLQETLKDINYDELSQQLFTAIQGEGK